VEEANTTAFALNNLHVIDFALKRLYFSRRGLQDFVCLWSKPCNFGFAHEAPPSSPGTG
jgi:hypothetical protein